MFIFVLLLINGCLAQQINLAVRGPGDGSHLPTSQALSGCSTLSPTSQGWALLSFTGSPVSSWPSASPTMPVYYGTTKLGTWATLFTGLTTSIVSAGGPSLQIWTGTDTSGGVLSNCASWTTNSIFSAGATGFTNSLTPMGTGGSAVCSNTFYYLCAYLSPTPSPTKNPTRNPTLKPTKNPTLNPTRNPTQNPTPHPTYLEKGQLRVFMLRQGSQITSNRAGGEWHSPTPVEMFVEGLLVPILWANVDWSLNGVAQTQIPLCNPIPTSLPGGTEYDNYGIRICPAIRACVSSTGPPFTSLRACVDAFTAQEAGADVQFNQVGLLIDGSLSTPTIPVVPQATINCNSAVDREVNCQLSRQSVNYILQCQSEPIECWKNETIGHFFGLMEDQNPKFPYYPDPLLWSDELYLGVASVLNNYTYYRDGVKVDPLNTENLNSYYWVGEFNLSSQSVVADVLMSPDVLQLEPLNWFGKVNGGLPISTCIASLKVGSLTGCSNLNAETTDFLQKPGLWLFPTFTGFPYYFNFTLGFTAHGAELYNNNTLIWQNLTTADEYKLPASGQYGAFSIRIMGTQSVWDIPSAQWSLNQSFVPDPLWSSLSLGPFQFPLYQLVSPNGVFFNTLTGIQESNWPYLNNGATPGTITVDISIQETQQQWQTIADLILNQNIYPPNNALLNWPYEKLPTNLTLDKPYLFDIWATHFSRRRVSEDVDCQTFGLGNVVNRPDGSPGGCACDAFFNPLLYCSQCLPGLGAPNCSLPYQPVIPGQPPQFFRVDQFFSSLSQSRLYIGGRAPLCDSLLWEGEYYALFTYSEISIIYLKGSTYFALVDETMYLNTTLVPFIEIQSLPFSPVWEGEGIGLVSCISYLTSTSYVWPITKINKVWWVTP